MTRLAKSNPTTLSDHDLKFRTPSGMSSGTATIDFNTAGFDDGSVDYTDIDLQYGSSQAQVNGSCSSSCTKATLAGTAGAGAWGASFGTNTLTFTYPTSGGTAIAINDYTRVLIGLNAVTGTNGDQQLTNPTSSGTKTITITLPSDVGKLAVAILTDDQVVVSTTIDPYLTFAVTQTTVSLTKSGGNPDYQNTGYNNGTANTLAANTNATTGYNISYLGLTLSANGGADTIDVMTGEASVEGEEQFGINLRANTDPPTGANKTGSGSATYASGYGDIDQFTFAPDTTTTLASAGDATVSNTFTVSYIVNVTEITEAGAYNTTITYICTGNF